MQLAYLAPGASEGNPTAYASGTRPDDRRPSSEITVNAQNDSVNNKTIDGMDNNEKVIGTIGVQPSIEAIQEVRVLTNLYTAEVGRTAGAVVDVITKSGTDDFHGSVYEFFRNNIFDARDYFDTPAVGEKPGLHQNQYGASLGGPIIHNKTFFFGAYEGSRTNQGLNVARATVPSACEEGRAACGGVTQLGNFSDLSTPIYDPLTGTPFPNNIIPVARISSVAQNFATLYPLPNLPGTANNYGATPTRTQNAYTVNARVDHHLGGNDTLTARYTLNNYFTFTPSTFPRVNVAGVNVYGGGTTGINGAAGNANQLAQNAALIYLHVFNPKLFGQVNTGYLRVSTYSAALNTGTNAATAFGISGINNPTLASGFATGMPLINVSGYSNLGDDGFVPLRDVDNTFQYNANLSWTPGNHVWKFGFSFINRQFASIQSQYPSGNYSFTQVPTAAQTAAGFGGAGGNGFASMLLGYPTQVNRNLSLIAPLYNVKEVGSYVQDDWHATKWLTLNLGLRWDVLTPYSERHNYLSNFNPKTGLLQQATPSDRYALLSTHWDEFSPRVGFAITLPGAMVVHGGGGVTFFPASYASQFSMKNPPTSSTYQTNFNSKFNTPGNPTVAAGAAKFSDPLPQPMAVPITCGSPATITNCPSGTLTVVAPDWRASHVFQTNLQLQKELAKNVISLGYVGVFGRALSTTVDINQLNTPGPQPAGTPLLGSAANPAQPYYGTYPLVSVINQQYNASSAHYNGLQTSVERRAANGLTLLATYTWSKEIDDEIYPGLTGYPITSCAPMYSCIVDNGNGTTRLVKGMNYEKGIGQNNIPQRVAVAANYMLPFGGGLHGVARGALFGWGGNILGSYSSGPPLNINEGAAVVLSQIVGTGSNAPGSRPNQIGAGTLTNKTPAAWFNTTAFTAQRIGTLGNAPRNSLVGPPFRKIDISLFKEFPIHENVRAQFRYEVFNLTNTPTFAMPTVTVASFTGGTSGTATTSGGFGSITSTALNATPRQMQFVLKIMF